MSDPSPESLRTLRGMDQTDRAILDALRANARVSYADLGAQVALSASAAKRRVDRLIADGIIQGFTIQVDPALDGMGTEAYVELFCRGTVAPHDLKRILSAVPEVVDAAIGSLTRIRRMKARFHCASAINLL